MPGPVLSAAGPTGTPQGKTARTPGGETLRTPVVGATQAERRGVTLLLTQVSPMPAWYQERREEEV